jgi:hypothetical protein
MSYPGQFETPGDGGMVAPPGYINPTTPGSATIRCGYVVQSLTFAPGGATPIKIGFDAPATWSDASWVSDISGEIWYCRQAGIYSITVAQNMTVQNISETVNPAISVYATLTSATTSEFNQVLESSQFIPIMTGDPHSLQMIVSGLVNADYGTTLVVKIADRSGNLNLSSGFSALPSPAGFLGWNLIAQGGYGNVGVIV